MSLLFQLKVLVIPVVITGLFFSTIARAEPSRPADVEIADILKTYVARPDASFKYEVTSTMPLNKADIHILHLTSQTWRDIEWKHWLFIVMPHQRKYDDKALLIIEGGRNSDNPPQFDIGMAVLMSTLSQQISAPIALLSQVPNQPLKDGRREDDLIAYTFDQYLKTGDTDYPLLLPMTKSAAAAMDAIQLWSNEQLGRPIERFFVTGASKRGWTTWLTAAVDDRVTGIAPLVIDVLNLEPQMKHQLRTYGRYSQMIQDYVNHNVLERMNSPRGRELMTIVDPYSYRDRITVPKLIVLGTNDPYWTVDAANLYAPDLTGPMYLHYSPNVGHNLGLGSIEGLSTTIISIASFIRMHFAGEDMPEIRWRHQSPDTLAVEWQGRQAQPVLWTAQSPNRDFRKAEWQSQFLEGQGKVEFRMNPPQEGWQAWFVELRFDGENPIRLTTTITVLPDTFPYEQTPESAQKTETPKQL